MFVHLLLSLLVALQPILAAPARLRASAHNRAGNHGSMNFKRPNSRSSGVIRDDVAPFVLDLKQTGTDSRSSQTLRMANNMNEGVAPLIAVAEGAGYAVDIRVGLNIFSLIFDTGSSDIWIASEDFECYDYYGYNLPEEDCQFGPLFNGSFTQGAVPNQNFNITYGDGEFVVGDMGYEEMCLAGVEVCKQQFALARQAYWEGDNVTSGILGFAYSSLTSAYEGTDPTKNEFGVNSVYYPTFMDNALAEGALVSPVFSHALNRNSRSQKSGGILALGGVPDIEIDPLSQISVPLQIADYNPTDNIDVTTYTYYSIVPDGFTLKAENGTLRHFPYPPITPDPASLNATVSPSWPAIVDSGTTLAYLPIDVASAVNKAFDPPAEFYSGIYEADCDATPPDFAVRIGGRDFWISKEEMLLTGEAWVDPSSGNCVTGIQWLGDLNVLGGTLLKNVLAVYDLGASEMRFLERMKY